MTVYSDNARILTYIFYGDVTLLNILGIHWNAGWTEPVRLGPVHFGPKIIKYFMWRHNQYDGTVKNI